MTATRLSPALLLAASFVLSAASLSAQTTQPKARLSAPIADTSRATLAGSQPPRARLSRDLGAVDGSTPLPSMTLYFSRSQQQQADLESLIAAQQNPSSPQYHQFLTPAQFGARFGVADSDIAKTEAWLQAKGFTVTGVSPSRNSISFAGTAATVASAFGAPLHHYAFQGKTHIAPSADLSLPSSLSGIVSDVRGLSDFRPHAHVRHANGALYKPNFTSSQTGNHYLTPGDIAVIYDIKAAYNAGYNGSGQTIAVVGQSAVSTTDVTNFQTAIGQTAKAPNIILVPNTGASATYSEDESESDLDLEYAGGIAPGATIDFVYVGANDTASVFDSLTYAITNRTAPIINISYGECEPLLGQSQYTSLNAVLQQAAAQGQTVVSAAGDDGSTDCYVGQGQGVSTATQEELAVDFPSSSQYVTGLGGTEFPAADVTASSPVTSSTTYFSGAAGSSSDTVVTALSYIPEQVWNDDSADGAAEALQYGLSSGGGGVSIFTPAPSWQTGVTGIPSGASFRLVPDIALDASPNDAPYAYCTSDSSAWASGQTSSCNSGLRDSASQDLTVAGGTSFAAPIFAGMVAIINQAKGYTYQGVVNPTLYTLASNATTYASAFHDITSGSNSCTLGSTYCGTGGGSTDYAAGTGYDEASGLGSVDLNNLITAWPSASGSTSSPSFTISATAVTVTAGNSATSTVTVTPANGYTGTINWSVAPSTIPDSCYSISPTAITGTSAVTATLNITTSTSSSTCGSGYSPLKSSAKGTTASLRAPVSPRRTPAPTALAAGVISLAFLGFAGRRRARRLPTLLAVLLLAGAGFGLSGCSGATTSGTVTTSCTSNCTTTTPTSAAYTVTLIGTDSATSTITSQATFTVTINATT